MSRPWISDLIGVLKGSCSVGNAFVKHHEEAIKFVIQHSSVKSTAEECLKATKKKYVAVQPKDVPAQILTQLQEAAARGYVIEKSLIQFIKAQNLYNIDMQHEPQNENIKSHQHEYEKYPQEIRSYEEKPNASSKEAFADNENTPMAKKYSTVKEKIDTITKLHKNVPKIELSDKDKEILRKLELEHEKKIQNEAEKSTHKVDAVKQITPEKLSGNTNMSKHKASARSHVKLQSSLSSTAKERKVPATRLQRMASFGTLGIGLGIGTVAEFTRRKLGLKDQSVGETVDSMFLTQANAERIVSTLCKVRGAALKIGQILSIQDSNVVSPVLQKTFERVRQSADFMPVWQVEKVLSAELGHNWRQKLKSFEEKPFAAASIGQVHHAVTLNGQNSAMKIQYPGVATSIQSDIENLVGVMKLWNIFPDGMFIDNLVEVAKRELAWEVDYVREAECTRKYRELVAPYPEYYVPLVIDELSTQQIFTTELISGVPVDKCANMDLSTREHISKLIMHLCLMELFTFRYMQTDPNWSNFFYNPDTKQLVLLDFGACRSYEKAFMDKYIEVINAASERDREKVLKLSQDMRFLTGYESKIMEKAHVDAVMILGQVFDKNNPYFDFGGQNVTKQIQTLVPTIIHNRLCPPPEEIYSLHRKLSGVFLLCAKLGVKVNCRDMFREAYCNYKFD